MIETLATDVELLAELRASEVELGRAQFRQLSVLAELNARNVPGSLGLRRLADLISAQLRCSPAEARRRAQAVGRFGARRALTGEPLEPVYPATAEALGTGVIGAEHAAAIVDTVERIPVADRAAHAEAVESTLLERARTTDPRTITLLGQRILAHLDPDGPAPAEERLQQSHRSVSLNRLPDSTGLLYGQLTRPVRRFGKRCSPRSRLGGRMMRSARTTGRRGSGGMTRSRKPADGCSRAVSCRITPACLRS